MENVQYALKTETTFNDGHKETGYGMFQIVPQRGGVVGASAPVIKDLRNLAAIVASGLKTARDNDQFDPLDDDLCK